MIQTRRGDKERKNDSKELCKDLLVLLLTVGQTMYNNSTSKAVVRLNSGSCNAQNPGWWSRWFCKHPFKCLYTVAGRAFFSLKTKFYTLKLHVKFYTWLYCVRANADSHSLLSLPLPHTRSRLSPHRAARGGTGRAAAPPAGSARLGSAQLACRQAARAARAADSFPPTASRETRSPSREKPLCACALPAGPEERRCGGGGRPGTSPR